MGTVNVITASQLDRIRARVCTIAMGLVPVPAQPTHTVVCLQLHETSLDTSREDERLRLKKLSDERAHRWPNTLQVRPPPLPCNAACSPSRGQLVQRLSTCLQATRARKERALAERLAAEERAREEVRVCAGWRSLHEQWTGLTQQQRQTSAVEVMRNKRNNLDPGSCSSCCMGGWSVICGGLNQCLQKRP